MGLGRPAARAARWRTTSTGPCACAATSRESRTSSAACSSPTRPAARALDAELGTEIDLRRFRTNLHLALDAPAWAEQEWDGATLRFAGGVVLRLLHPCQRCAIPTRDPETQEKWPELLRHLDARHARLFGINARVVRSGRIERHEAVELEPPR